MKLDNCFLQENMMGPNAWRIAEELTKNLPLRPGMRVLDLGCGRGLTTVFLAQTFGVEVFAVDLWTSATENLVRFQQAGVSHLTVPLQFDALQLPFAEEFFDAVVSVDAYHTQNGAADFIPAKQYPCIVGDILRMRCGKMPRQALTAALQRQRYRKGQPKSLLKHRSSCHIRLLAADRGPAM